MRCFVPLLMVASTLGAGGHMPNSEKYADRHADEIFRMAGHGFDTVGSHAEQVRRHLPEVSSTSVLELRSAGLMPGRAAGGTSSQPHDQLPSQTSIKMLSFQHGPVDSDRHARAEPARRYPLAMLRSIRAGSVVGVANGEPKGKEPAKETSRRSGPPALSTLANSTAERWRLIAAGYLPAEAPSSTKAPAAAAKPVQELAGQPPQKTPQTLRSYHSEAHDHRDTPNKEDEEGALDKYSSGGKDKYNEPREFLGLPKIFWAMVADLIAMACFVACIPFILTIAKRRRPISSS